MDSDKELDQEEDSSGYTESLASEIDKGLETLGSDRFRDITPIYTSRSGAAMLCSATRYGKRFILKSLKEDFRFNPVYRTALTKEFEIGIGLDHPNIRRTIGMEEIDGLGPTIIMEYIDGETLDIMTERGAINASNARNIASQLADALAYIHSKQVIHRDLKPSNIMVTHSGNVVKLIDFSLSDGDSYMVIKVPAGTRSYMAPEQLLHGAKPDAKADIYSFGIILHDLAVLGNDHELLKISSSCTRKDSKSRPGSIDETGIRSLPADKGGFFSAILSSRITTYILALLIVLFLLAGSFVWFHHKTESDSVQKDPSTSGIEVKDLSLWQDRKE